MKARAEKSATRTARRGKDEVSHLADKAIGTAQQAQAQLSHGAAAMRDTVRDADVPAALRRPPVPRAAIAAAGVAVALTVAGALRRSHRRAALARRLAYRPVGTLAGAAAGALASLAFKRAWKIVSGDDDAPDATDEARGWGEILATAAVQGAIFALVRAAVDRGAATGVRHVTGRWPD